MHNSKIAQNQYQLYYCSQKRTSLRAHLLDSTVFVQRVQQVSSHELCYVLNIILLTQTHTGWKKTIHFKSREKLVESLLVEKLQGPTHEDRRYNTGGIVRVHHGMINNKTENEE